MKVRFGEINEEGLRFTISDESWFPDHELARTGPVRSIVSLKRKGMDRVLLTGAIQTEITFDCDRCTEKFNNRLESNFTLDLEYAPDAAQQAAEHECSPMEMDVIYLNEPAIDIFEILRQQVFLVLSEKHLCSDSCKGLCSSCGTNLNFTTCDCKKELKLSPFDILRKKEP